MGMSWFAMDSIPDDARKLLGLPLREEQFSFETAMWHVAQLVSERAQASRDMEGLVNQWLEQATSSLAGPSHEVSFTEPDGQTVTKYSSSMTPEERQLYAAQYVQQQASSWSNVPASPGYWVMRENHWLEDVLRRELRERRWREEALRRLEGPSHEVTLRGPDGKLIKMNSSSLTAEERHLYARQYAEQQRTIEREKRPNPVSAGKTETLRQQPNLTEQTPSQHQQSPASTQPQAAQRNQAPPQNPSSNPVKRPPPPQTKPSGATTNVGVPNR
jgi:hypothetical protein